MHALQHVMNAYVYRPINYIGLNLSVATDDRPG